MAFEDKLKGKEKDPRNTLIPVVSPEKEKEEEVERTYVAEEEVIADGIPIKLSITVKEEKKRKGMAKTFWLREDTSKGFKKLAKQTKKSESQLLQEILENVLKQNNIQ